MNIAILASGSGSNAENIIRNFKNSGYFRFPLIISNRVDAYVHERARTLNIGSVTFSAKEFKTGERVLQLLREEKIDAVVLAGFLLKVPENIVDAYPNAIINIHPALLPSYGGKGMYGEHVHRAVFEAGEKESGITIHYVSNEYDEGDIIFQAKCTIERGDRPEDIARKVQQLEHEHFPKVIEQIWGEKAVLTNCP